VVCLEEESPIMIEMESQERSTLKLLKEEDSLPNSDVPIMKTDPSKKSTMGIGYCVCFDETGNYIYIGTNTGKIMTFDRTTKEVNIISLSYEIEI
jgi:hypothetical protein